MNAQGMNDRGTAPLLDYIESVIGAWPMIRKPKKHVEKKWTDLFADVYSKAGLSYIIQVNNDSHSIMVSGRINNFFISYCFYQSLSQVL